MKNNNCRGNRLSLRFQGLLLCIFLMLYGCSSTVPIMNLSMEPFTDKQPLGEFTRKAALWEKDYRLSDGNFSIIGEIPSTTRTNHLVTNNQDGVDGGDRVKRIGDYIVVSRQGRLFSFSFTSDTASLKAIDFIDYASADENIDS